MSNRRSGASANREGSWLGQRDGQRLTVQPLRRAAVVESARMSSLAWIDFDEAERQRAQRIMALFQEREARDELGLGAIRDSIADHLFPGTSTIQTRLRYMLFIPWLFQMLEESTAGSDQLKIEARALENRLANALKAGGESHGVIGRDAGADLQRLPSSVYWAGLGTWGIRVFTGSTDNLFSYLPRLRNRSRETREGDDVTAEDQALQLWSPSLPCPPKNLLGEVRFRLGSEEAAFIIDRLVSAQPRSLLTFLARSGAGSADCANIWEHPHLADFPIEARTLVGHSEVFSSVMHGAALLYNLLLSRLRENPDWVENMRLAYKNGEKAWICQRSAPGRSIRSGRTSIIPRIASVRRRSISSPNGWRWHGPETLGKET